MQLIIPGSSGCNYLIEAFAYRPLQPLQTGTPFSSRSFSTSSPF
jgi:hypothetical protein